MVSKAKNRWSWDTIKVKTLRNLYLNVFALECCGPMGKY